MYSSFLYPFIISSTYHTPTGAKRVPRSNAIFRYYWGYVIPPTAADDFKSNLQPTDSLMDARVRHIISMGQCKKDGTPVR